MATNDFLPFAYGGGANVLSQSAYSALTTLLSGGYQSGIANSAQMNKTWRQSSIMAAVLGQFSADYSGQNSTDDGTTATLETNLVAAIRSATKTGVLLADTGAANAYTATNVPALTSLVNGLVQQVTIAHANTGASTYAPDGLTAAPIYGLALQPLQGGELFVGGTAVLVRATIAGVNTGNPIWVLMECAGGAQQIAPATQSQHAPQAGQVQRSAFNYAGLAGGTANAITATLNVVPTSYTDYLIVTVRIASTNTGSVSLNVNGLGIVPVIGQGHQTLQGGELVAGGFATFAYSQNFSEAILLASTGGPVQVGAATQSQHAVQLGQLASGTVNIGNRAQFPSSSSFTVPANVTTIWHSGCAGGGGGGGSGGISGVTASWSSTSGGGGGQPGQFVRRVPITVTPGQTLTISIGAAGTSGSAGVAGGAGGNGGNGGNTTISGTGVSVTLTGGAGGTGSAAISGANNVVGAPGSAGGIGADDGFWGIAVSGYGYDIGGQGGRGGNTPFGTSGGATKMQSAARAGAGYGAGGSGGGGAVTQSSSVGYAGATGGAGYLEFEW